jgi:hypothetical protein
VEYLVYVNAIIVSLKCLTILSLHPSIVEEDEIIGTSMGCMCSKFFGP